MGERIDLSKYKRAATEVLRAVVRETGDTYFEVELAVNYSFDRDATARLLADAPKILAALADAYDEIDARKSDLSERIEGPQ